MSPTSYVRASSGSRPEPLTGGLGGRRVLITGAASGIGLACARSLSMEGAGLALIDRDRPQLDDAAATLVGATTTIRLDLDVSDFQAVAEGVGKATEALGGLDGIVNSAGIDLHGPFEETDWAAWNRLMAVNLTGAMHVCRAALTPLKASGRGAIVNIASAAGLRPISDRVAYCASKAGLIMATKALALDLAKHGIRANAVCPGAVDTPLFRGGLSDAVRIDEVEARYAMRRIGAPSEVAAAVLFLLSDEASFMTGSALTVDGGRVFH